MKKESLLEEAHRRLDRAMIEAESDASPLISIVEEIESLNLDDLELSIQCDRAKAIYWEKQDDFEQAETFYLGAYTGSFQLEEYIKDSGILALEIATFYQEFHRYEQAIKFYENAKTQFQKIDDLTLTLDTCLLEGELYEELGEYPEAEALFQLVIQTRLNLNHPKGLLMAFVKLGDLFLTQKKLEKAEEALQQALVFSDFNPHQKYLAYISLLDFYRKTSNSRQAERYILEVEADAELKANPDLQVFLFHYYLDIEQLKKAEELYQSIEKNYLVNAQFSKVKFLYSTGLRLYKGLNQLEQGRRLYQQYYAIVEQEYQYADLWLLHSIYGDFLLHFKLHEEAFTHFKRSAQALESFRQRVPENFDRITFFQEKVVSLNRFCQKAIYYSNYELALFFLESGKSKSLIDLLTKKAVAPVLTYPALKKLLA